MAYIELTGLSGSKKKIPIDSVITIGCAHSCTVCIDEPGIPSEFFSIQNHLGTYSLIAFNETIPVILNGRHVTQMELKSGDSLSAGHNCLHFYLNEAEDFFPKENPSYVDTDGGCPLTNDPATILPCSANLCDDFDALVGADPLGGGTPLMAPSVVPDPTSPPDRLPNPDLAEDHPPVSTLSDGSPPSPCHPDLCDSFDALLLDGAIPQADPPLLVDPPPSWARLICITGPSKGQILFAVEKHKTLIILSGTGTAVLCKTMGGYFLTPAGGPPLILGKQVATPGKRHPVSNKTIFALGGNVWQLLLEP